MYYLFLDDERNPEHVKWVKLPQAHWVVVRNIDDFRQYIAKNNLPIFISFDHDLGVGPSGLDCAKWLVNYCEYNKLTFPNYTVHSLNPIGKENIEGYLKSYKNYLNKI